MNTTVTDVTAQAPLSHDEAMDLQAVELERTLEMLRRLGPADWTTQTECPDWDVRRMYLHVLGACEASASMRENMHQMRAAMKHRKAHGGPLEAGLSNVQVRERIDLTAEELVERLAAIVPVTVRKRTKMPALMRRAPMKIDGPVHETWRLGYLIDTIYLRDAWMHRVDTAQVTGSELHLTADHDGRIVTDVVAEWARRHGRPFTLTLTGPAGGVFTSAGTDGADATATAGDAGSDRALAAGGESIELDAVDFCRIFAGRLPAPSPLFETIVPF